jgi:hypothetical protein
MAYSSCWGQGEGGGEQSQEALASFPLNGVLLSAIFHMLICLLDTWTSVLLSSFLVQIVVQFSFILC